MKILLAEGANVNARSGRGQTALMLAAIFGRDEIVSLLLTAGADVHLKDSLGLTATEWSIRRGFPNIAQIIANPSAPKLPTPTNEMDARVPGEGHSEAHIQTNRTTEAGNRRPAAATDSPGGETENIQASKPRLGVAGLAMLKARAAQVAEVEAKAASLRQQTTVSPSRAHATSAGRQMESPEPATAGAQSTATAPETTKPRVEPDRMPAASRSVVEKEISKPSELQTENLNPTVPADKRAIPAATLTPATPAAIAPKPAFTNASHEPSNTKRCPKCHTFYKNTLLVYCPRDTTRLWRVEAASFNQLPAHSSARSILWVMIAITLGGAAFATYRLTNRSPETIPPTAAVATTEPPKVAPVKPLPAVGGALVGAELDLPDPEYPKEAVGKGDSEGISGPVTVRVQVNGKGKVVSTRVLNGPWPLRMAATKAAKKATFDPEKLAGKSKVVAGTITYNFIAPQAEPSAPAESPTAAPAVTESKTTSGSPVANPDGAVPVTGDALAGTEINLPRADYPESARSKEISGTITVTVRVNRAGRVISWRTSAGDSRLRAAALQAAKKATFDPEKLPGKGEVVGTIIYHFKL